MKNKISTAVATLWATRLIAVILVVVFFGVYFITHYVSLGSVLAAATFGVGFTLFYPHDLLVVSGGWFMSLLTIFQHRENIRRLTEEFGLSGLKIRSVPGAGEEIILVDAREN